MCVMCCVFICMCVRAGEPGTHRIGTESSNSHRNQPIKILCIIQHVASLLATANYGCSMLEFSLFFIHSHVSLSLSHCPCLFGNIRAWVCTLSPCRERFSLFTRLMYGSSITHFRRQCNSNVEKNENEMKKNVCRKKNGGKKCNLHCTLYEQLRAPTK